MAAVVVSSAGTISPATGYPVSPSIIYDGSKYWAFYLSSAQASKICARYSTDGMATWSTEQTRTATNIDTSAQNFSVINSGTTALVLWFDATDGRVFQERADTSGTSLSWASSVLTADSGITSRGLHAFLTPAGVPGLFRVSTAGYNRLYFATNVLSGTFVDTNWTDTAGPSTDDTTSFTGAAFPLASGAMTIFDDNGNKLRANAYTGTWGGNALLWGGAGVSNTLWGAAARSTTDICVLGVTNTGASPVTMQFKQYNGSTWSALTAPAGPTAGISTSGLALHTNGTDYYALALLGDNSGVAINTYSGTSWSGWTNVETSSQVRSHIQVGPVAGTNLGMDWNQTNGSNFDVISLNHALSGPPPSTTVFRRNIQSRAGSRSQEA